MVASFKALPGSISETIPKFSTFRCPDHTDVRTNLDIILNDALNEKSQEQLNKGIDLRTAVKYNSSIYCVTCIQRRIIILKITQ